MNRNTITVMSGQVVDFFDNDFRELYAVSDKVDLYREFHISKPSLSVPVLKTPAEPDRPPIPVSTSRFQVLLEDTKKTDLKVPAHKYHNPKYSLVVGNSLGITGSLQDLSTLRDYDDHDSVNNIEQLIYTNGDGASTQDATEDGKDDGKKLSKKRSSFRHFLKGRANQNPDATNQSQDPKQISHKDTKITNNSNEASWLVTQTKEDASKDIISTSLQKNSETGSTDELDDTFEIIANPPDVKFKSKKSKMGQRSSSLQVIPTFGEEGTCAKLHPYTLECLG